MPARRLVQSVVYEYEDALGEVVSSDDCSPPRPAATSVGGHVTPRTVAVPSLSAAVPSTITGTSSSTRLSW